MLVLWWMSFQVMLLSQLSARLLPIMNVLFIFHACLNRSERGCLARWPASKLSTVSRCRTRRGSGACHLEYRCSSCSWHANLLFSSSLTSHTIWPGGQLPSMFGLQILHIGQRWEVLHASRMHLVWNLCTQRVILLTSMPLFIFSKQISQSSSELSSPKDGTKNLSALSSLSLP